MACATVVVLLAGLSPAFAQYELIDVAGQVVADGASGSPLAGAEVLMLGINGTITTTSGQFRLRANKLMIGRSVTFRVTMPGWHIKPGQPLEIIVPADPIQHPLRFVMVRDQSPPISASALSPGIYLTHLVGEVGNQDRPTTASIWLAGAGPNTFIVDSVTITHHVGAAASIGTGAQRPDATYSFEFRAGSTETHILDPALRLDKADRREVWFTLGLAPSGFFGTSGGWVEAYLHYRVEGKPIAGVLALQGIPEQALSIAKLLHREIEVDPSDGDALSYATASQSSLMATSGNTSSSGLTTFSSNATYTGLATYSGNTAYPGSTSGDPLLVTPSGLLKGVDALDDDVLIYSPLLMNQNFVGYYTNARGGGSVADSAGGFSLSKSRLRLNSAIAQARAIPRIIGALQAGDSVAFDLCAGLVDSPCFNALVESAKNEHFAGNALQALMLSQLLKPDKRFAEVITSVARSSDKNNFGNVSVRDFAAVLAHTRTGPWLDALLALAQSQSYDATAALDAINNIPDTLTAADRQKITAACEALLDSASPKLEHAKCLLHQGVSMEKVSAQLERIPSGLDPAELQRVLPLRSDLKQRLRAEAGDQK